MARAGFISLVFIAILAWLLAPHQQVDMPWQGMMVERSLTAVFALTRLVAQYNSGAAVAMFRTVYRVTSPPDKTLFNDSLLITDTTLGPNATPVRVYRPKNTAKPSTKPGALVYLHGGGWTVGDLETHDAISRVFAAKSGFVVISVDYPLAPENKFPAGPNACYDVTKHIMENAEALGVDARRIVVGGDSAGGNLAAVVAQMFQDRHADDATHRLAGQILIYPALKPDFLSESYQRYGECTGISRSVVMWFYQHYMNSQGDLTNPYFAPLHAKIFSGLPPTYLAVCQHDVLRSEAEQYAQKLRDSGVKVNEVLVKGCYHGMLGDPSVELAFKELEMEAKWLASL